MAKSVLINGAGGRIGRSVTYEVIKLLGSNAKDITLVAVNEPRGLEFVVDSYKSRDPVHGFYNWDVGGTKGSLSSPDRLTMRDYRVSFFAEKDISKVLESREIDIVLECSGFFGDPKQKDKSVKLTKADNGARIFLEHGAKTVIQTYPAKTADVNLVMGVNHQSYDSEKHKVISNASCTTKALAMPLQVLIDNGIEIDALSMDTTHAATASQEVLHSLGQIVTHATGAAKATGLVIPSLEGRMSGMSYRVPTLDGSFANLYFVALSENKLTSEDINKMFYSAAKNQKYAGRIGIFGGEDAGTFDIVGRRENAVIIPSKTSVIPLSFGRSALVTNKQKMRAHLVTVISGYDNELGSSVDPVLLADYIAKKS